jgi:nicotinate-nucleotide adenylyltransferase
MARIGIFGGSFDPVHTAHILLADRAREEHSLDKVVFVPAGRPPHKTLTPLAPDHDRLEMLRLAFAHHPHFEVSTIELERDAPSYTLTTLHELKKALGDDDEIVLIIGSDSLYDLPNWWRADELVGEAEIVCLERPDFPLDHTSELEERFGAEFVAGIKRRAVSSPAFTTSSTEIRRRLKQGLSIKDMVPESVREYIAAYGLYSQA